ncbi:MAG: flavin mononucleotide-binding protein [Winogradskyella sp.]|nr:flavin mononucleotide-binding protein [Winogradskyella sp.]
MIQNLKENRSVNILHNNYLGNLSYISNNEPYVIPITYFFDKKRNIIICYSSIGHKIKAMRKNPSVSLIVANVHSIENWESVLVLGTYEEIEGSSAKVYLHDFSLGIKDIIEKKEARDVDYISEFSSKIYADDIPIVFSIKIDKLIGKKRRTT